MPQVKKREATFIIFFLLVCSQPIDEQSQTSTNLDF